MNESNSELLEVYLNGRKLSDSSRDSYKKSLMSFDKAGKPLMEATLKDLELWYTHADLEYAPSTIISYALHLTHLYRFGLQRDGVPKREAKNRTEDLFEVIPFRDLRRADKKQSSLRDKLVTPEEFRTIMKAASYPRTQALLAVLYDSGCRKGEIIGEGGLKIRHVEFRGDHAIIRVKGKTGERTIPLKFSLPYLKAYLQTHPDRDNLEAPLFATTWKGRIKHLSLSSVNHLIANLCEKTGTRHLYPHMLRHTRFTEYADADLGEFKLKSLAGWTADSRMAARYVHLSGTSHVNKVLEIQGVEIEAKNGNGLVQLLENLHCPQCDGDIGLNALFCPQCGFILDEKLRHEKAGELEALKAEVQELSEFKNTLGMLNEILDTPEKREKFKRLLEGY